MAKLTILFGVLLIVVGVTGFMLTGHEHYTSLIPALIGLILVLSGTQAMTQDLKKRGLWMHLAATVGLLGFVGTIKSAFDVRKLAAGVEFPHPIAVEEKAATCLLCLLFVAFCVRSFLEARRARMGAV